MRDVVRMEKKQKGITVDAEKLNDIMHKLKNIRTNLGLFIWEAQKLKKQVEDIQDALYDSVRTKGG